MTRRRRLALLAALVALTVVGAAAWLVSRDPGPAPVVPTTLEANPLVRRFIGPAWRNLPLRLSPAEEQTLGECRRLARLIRTTADGRSEFDADATRRQLEDLCGRPPAFYGEYLLGLWHQRRGNAEESRRYYAAAEADAPVTLVQRFQHEDGTPLVGGSVRFVEVECNRVRNGSLDPSLKLEFFDLVTDGDGCVRLPVYRTVYRLFGISHPQGYSADFPPLGWFESRGRVGLLPAATVKPVPK